MSSRSLVPTQDQALQQVIVLKKELAEMRAKQAQIIDQGQGANPEAVLEREVAKARGQISTASSDAAIERSARIEMQQSLEVSEQSVRISRCFFFHAAGESAWSDPQRQDTDHCEDSHYIMGTNLFSLRPHSIHNLPLPLHTQHFGHKKVKSSIKHTKIVTNRISNLLHTFWHLR